MLQISDELRAAFLNDNVKKNIEIEFEPTVEVIPDDFSRVNFYEEKDASDTTSAVVGYGYSNEDAYGQILLSNSNHRIFPLSGSTNALKLTQYQKHAKYVYVDFYIKINNLSGIATNSLVKLYFHGSNALGYYNTNMAYSLEILNTTYSVLSNDYVHVVATIPLVKEHMTSDDICFLNSWIIVQFYQNDGTRYPYDTTCAFTCYIKPNIHIQLGDEVSAFPYQNDVQVGYLGLNLDDYVIFNEYPDKFSRVNFWNESIPHEESRTNVSLAWLYGVGLEDWLIKDYLQDVNLYNLTFKCKITSITLASGVSTPVKYCFVLYRKKADSSTSGNWSATKDFQLNVDETFSFIDMIGNMEQYGYVDFSGLYICFYKSDGQGGFTRYSSSEIGSFAYQLSDISFNLGTYADEMPYSDTVQVEYIGGNIEDYLVYPPHTDGFTLDNSDLIAESFSLTESISGSDKLKFGATESAVCEFESPTIVNKDLFGLYFRPYISCEGFEERVPLGRFRVKNVTRRGSHNLVTKRIQAYDGIYPLSRSGSSWYTNYMGLVYNFNKTFTGVSQRVWTAPRQMFATLYNVLDNIDIELPIENISIGTVTLYNTTQADGGKIILKERAGSDYYNSDYVDCSIAYGISVSPAKKYRVRIGYDYKTVLNEYFEEVGYRSRFGLYPSRGGVIIAEQDSDGKINMFSVNDGDWFAVSPNATYIQILIPSKYHIWSGDEENLRLREMTVNYPSTIHFDNGDFDLFSSNNEAMRLVYYNWKTYELGQPTSTTYRDIIRSLVEITGYFFRYGRNGNIEFIKGEIAGLYPSNELYPADNLYPRGGSVGNEVLVMGKYRSFECDDKETNHFGRVQILLSAVNENEPSTRNYTGDVTKKNVYVMTDNVFYCASGVSYAMKNDGTDPLPELTTMLSNMYNVISSIYYIPCEVEAYGMPWFECGDRIGLLTNHGGFETFIFRRRMTGIQYLTDDYEALGDENTDSVVDAWN